jgi:hypothetical protein
VTTPAPAEAPSERSSVGPAVIGLIADTHGWVDPALEPHFRDVALILHAGDVGGESVLVDLGRLAPLVAVRGNIDGGALSDLPPEAVVTVAGKRIAVRHIAGTPGRPNPATRALLDRERPDVLVVGHSHIPVAGYVGSVLWINPGAAGHQGFHHQRTAGLLAIDPDGRMEMRRIVLGTRGHGRM